MEEVVYNGNLKAVIFNESNLNDAEMAQVANGLFPIIVAQGGVFTKRYVSEAELSKFSHWDALQTDKDAQHEIHGNLPIVWECGENGMIETGLEHQVFEAPTEEAPTE